MSSNTMKPFYRAARVGLTAQVPIERAVEVDDIAQRLGITRHQLLLRALDAGIPMVLSQTVQQSPIVKE